MSPGQRKATAAPTAFLRLGVLVAALLAAPLIQAAPPAIAWNREDARRALTGIDLEPTVTYLARLTTPSDPLSLLDALEATANRQDWPAPARDAALHRYALRLQRLPAREVPGAAIRWLEAYRPQALVPHEDHHGGDVPLFNVRAAAIGATHAWLREAALLEGLELARDRPDGLVDTFLQEAHPVARAGYLEALEQAAPDELARVGKAVNLRLASQQALTPLAARVAVLRRDAIALGAVLDLGAGPALHEALGAVALEDDAELAMDVLEAALGGTNPTSAQLAIAELYPVLAGRPPAERALLDHLGDEATGTAAALALSASPAPATLATLQRLAREPDALTARHARLALRLRAEDEAEALR